MKPGLRHIFLFNLSVQYGLITGIRNKLFDWGIFKIFHPDIPTICVGNLAVGGTGKTPMVEYLISRLISQTKVAVLSRGYKRKTKGFVLGLPGNCYTEIGDEPAQILQRFGEKIKVAVDEDRTEGIKELLKLNDPPQLILLDDAFQHRKVSAGLNILITSFQNLFYDDYPMPGGHLREYPSGYKRADIILVSKCPSLLTESEAAEIREKIRPLPHQKVYFTGIHNGIPYHFDHPDTLFDFENEMESSILLVTGIGKPGLLGNYLRNLNQNCKTLRFPDHHPFSTRDLDRVNAELRGMQGRRKFMMITEKDAARLRCKKDFPAELREISYVIPMEIFFIFEVEKTEFNQKIQNYVEQN